jgi:hypothetical protein
MRTSVAALLALVGGAGFAAAAGEPPPSYAKDVKPFLAKYCMDCHNDTKARSGYSVETFDRLTKQGRRGALVVPEKPDDSMLIRTMGGKGKQMPPRKAAQPRAEEIAKVSAWIKAGAKDDTPAGKGDAKADNQKGGDREARRKGGDDDDDKRERKRRGERKREREDDDDDD